MKYVTFCTEHPVNNKNVSNKLFFLLSHSVLLFSLQFRRAINFSESYRIGLIFLSQSASQGDKSYMVWGRSFCPSFCQFGNRRDQKAAVKPNIYSLFVLTPLSAFVNSYTTRIQGVLCQLEPETYQYTRCL